METDVRELCRTLDEEIALYKLLLGVMRREQDCIIAADHEGLLESVSQVEQHVIAIKEIKARRRGVMERLWADCAAGPAEPTLEHIIPMMPPRLAASVQEMKNQLASLVRNIGRVNEENKIYVGDALSLYDEMVAHLTGRAPEPHYPGAPVAARRRAAGSMYVSREA